MSRDRVAGFYVTSTLYIAYFMWPPGQNMPDQDRAVSIGVSVAFFLIFEIWFSVPLPKGRSRLHWGSTRALCRWTDPSALKEAEWKKSMR